MTPARVLLVLVGSGIGGVARYLLGGLVTRVLGTTFPFGTLAVNLIGSFLIMLFMRLALRGLISHDVRLFLTTGLMGGLTTYSSFCYETMAAFESGSVGIGFAYIVATLLGCLAAAGLALALARWLL